MNLTFDKAKFDAACERYQVIPKLLENGYDIIPKSDPFSQLFWAVLRCATPVFDKNGEIEAWMEETTDHIEVIKILLSELQKLNAENKTPYLQNWEPTFESVDACKVCLIMLSNMLIHEVKAK